MFCAIIVDDEPFVIKSLLSSMPWDLLGIEVSATFTNGNDALEYVEKNPIHFVFTDIRMPGLSGLDLSNHLHEKYPHIKIIIISGYADFTYAQKSITYNVLGYFVKPLDYNEITLLLQNTISKSDITAISNYDIIDAIEDENFDFLSSYFEKLNCECFHILISIGTKELPRQIVDNCITIKLGRNQYAYLSNDPFDNGKVTLDILHNYAINGVCIYPTPTHLNSLKHDIKDSITMAYQFFMLDEIHISTKKFNLNYSSIIKSIKSALDTNNINKIKVAISNLKNKKYMSSYSIHLILKIYNIFITHYTDINNLEIEDEYIYNYEDLCKRFNSYDHVLEALSALLVKKVEVPDMPSTYNNNFINILQFINDNYATNISIENIAHQLSLNQNYISQLFRKETGDTYTSYLTNLRINKAKDLLQNTNLSLSDISDCVGYNDYFYFLKIFKKQVGVSPGKFKSTMKGIIR